MGGYGATLNALNPFENCAFPAAVCIEIAPETMSGRFGRDAFRFEPKGAANWQPVSATSTPVLNQFEQAEAS